MTASSLRVLAIALLTAGAACAQSDSVPDPEAAKLVEEIAKKPEIYHQSCMAPERDPELSVLVSFRGATSDTQHSVSVKQFKSLRAKRAGAIRALEAWLKEKSAPDAKEEETHAHPSRTRMLMLVDLNASEALPALKKYAEKWKKVWDDGGGVVKVDWAAFRTMAKEKQDAILQHAEAGEKLGDAMSAIVAILRREKFEPLRLSQFGKTSDEAVAAARGEGWMAEVIKEIDQNGGKIPQPEKEYVFVDSVLKKAVTNGAFPVMKATPEMFGQLLGFVDEWAKLPAEKKLGEKGMTEWPVVR